VIPVVEMTFKRHSRSSEVT